MNKTAICIHGNSLYAWSCAAALSQYNDVQLITSNASLDQPFLVYEPELIAHLVQQQATQNLSWNEHTPNVTQAIHIIAHEDGFEMIRVLLAQIAAYPNSRYIVVTALLHMNELEQLASETQTLSSTTHPLDFIYMPEFIREGFAIHDINQRSLLLVSSHQTTAAQTIRELFEPFTTKTSTCIATSHQNAYLIVTSIHAMLATRISFINEIALIADETGADIKQIEQGIGADPRIGHAYLSASCGFGGSKFSQNIQNFMNISAKYLGYPGLIQTVYTINESQKEALFRKIWQHFKGNLSGKHFAIWGCAYKANSSSTQLGAIHTMLECLWSQQCTTSVYDPQALNQLQIEYPNTAQLSCADSALAALVQADALIVLTDWAEFSQIDIAQITASLKQPIVFDGRNIFDPVLMSQHHIHYYGIGQRSHTHS